MMIIKVAVLDTGDGEKYIDMYNETLKKRIKNKIKFY